VWMWHKLLHSLEDCSKLPPLPATAHATTLRNAPAG
jgi:hypothetical protein